MFIFFILSGVVKLLNVLGRPTAGPVLPVSLRQEAECASEAPDDPSHCPRHVQAFGPDMETNVQGNTGSE